MNNKKDEPTIETATITPAIAKDLLAGNKKNRSIKPKVLATIIRALENGEWRYNGETIKVATDGTLVDGQHRLTACVETGIPFRTLIFWNAEMDTQDTVDTGGVRSLKDQLEIRGEGDATRKASFTRAFIQQDAYGVRRAVQNSEPLTLTECLDYFDKHREEIVEHTAPSRKIAQATPLSPTSIAVLRREFRKIDTEDADYFFNELVSGMDLPGDHAIQVLRRQLFSIEKSGQRVGQVYLAALTVKAWNKYRAGEKVGMLKFRPGGANPEKFPEAS